MADRNSLSLVEALERCPFCGVAAVIQEERQEHPSGAEEVIGWTAGCSNAACPACPTVFEKEREDAAHFWNARADHLPLHESMMALRKEEGRRLREIAKQLLTTSMLGALQGELQHLADELECGNPLGDCGCEGTCFTGGDDE